MASVGRPKFKITPAVCKKARELAAQGLTLSQIASCLGISYETLNEKSKEFSEFSDSIRLGKDEGIQQVVNALYTKAKDGDTHAMKYFLNNRDNANWKDRIVNTHEGSVGLTDLSEDELNRKIRILSQKLDQASED